jgi:hypothetical protein
LRADEVKRTWTDSTGKFKLEATFVGIKDGKVSLKRGDGSITEVPLNKLSPADQKVVRELVSKNDD